MHAGKWVHTGIAAALSLAAAGAQADGWVINNGQTTVECSGRTLTSGVVNSFATKYTFTGVAVWGVYDSVAGIIVPAGAGLPALWNESIYLGNFFPDSKDPRKGTMGAYLYDEGSYPDYKGHFETLQLRVLAPDKSGLTKLAGQSIAVMTPFVGSGTTGDAMTAICEWRLEGFAEPFVEP